MNDRPMWEPTAIDDEPVTLESVIYQAIGTASVCWKAPPTSHGVFDSEMAQWVADGLLAKIEEHVSHERDKVTAEVQELLSRQRTLNTSNSDGTVEVPAHVLLYAVRYGMGRLSAANADAHELIRIYWPVLRQWRDSIVTDLEYYAEHTLKGYADLGEQCTETLQWIGEREAADELSRLGQGLPPERAEVEEIVREILAEEER